VAPAENKSNSLSFSQQVPKRIPKMPLRFIGRCPLSKPTQNEYFLNELRRADELVQAPTK